MSRVAVVTGAASGIGLGVARRFAADGHRVALLDRQAEAAEAAAAELRAEGATAIAAGVDVADWSAVHDAFDGVRAELGPVEILVTSAGIESFDAARDIDAETWHHILGVNLTGTFVSIQAALGDMIDAGWGRIVTISSSSAQSGAPHMAHYAASKGGVMALTKALARELAGGGITVNTIPPSLVDTPMARDAEARGLVSVDAMAAMVPVGRAGTPDDIAAACSYLCSDDAAYVTGQVIGVNGGMYIERAATTASGGFVTGDFDQVDFFSDESLLEDPYPYFDHLRAKCPVTPLPHHGVVAVTGYEEATEVYRNIDTFSSCNSVIGPFATFPEPLEGDDISALIEANRHQLPMNEHMVTMDPPEHTRQRALLMRLLTPKRLQQNEEFMWRLADQQLDEFIADGHCEFIAAYSQPFAMLVVADLLGVPESDHQRFREGFGLSRAPGELGAEDGPGLNALEFLDDYFADYIEERRREPAGDVLTDLALAKYPDGSTPEVVAVVRTATFLFAAGQETTARLLATSLKHLAEHPELQVELRTHRDRIPDFTEEALRIESPVKADFRLARRATTVGGVEIEPGTPVMLLNGAANRDARRFDDPAEFRLGRPDTRDHIAFGRGQHSCPGAPLARAEGRISIERILDRMHDIRLSEEHHGPAGARRFEYTPTWVLRGLQELHLEFTPSDG